ncbi:hypothetical protein [Desulfurobacterium atlanticum]|uniref:Uncharacterized protein n=1 Tax=Desulfurobacterium atlanticum TaxID=240169 RepID=A0A238YRC7_9BACT|nr:hypothetical protein [Desulfurobacterium atlanticum]SNR73687.1 hypothetical protein SAMN06265340_104133 [Desulfurobacterium atlanticum]
MKKLMLATLFVAAGLTGCGGGTSTEDILSTSTSVSGIDYADSILTGGGYTVRAQLGDLDGASVNVKNLTTRETLWEGETKNGVFKIPDTVALEDNEVYLITVSGGTDLDTNDDGFYGDSAPNYGTIYAIVTGTDIKNNNLVVSPLTTYAYETLYKSGYFSDINTVKKEAYWRLRNAFGNIVIPLTTYTWGMTDNIYQLMKDYVDDIRNGETDKVKIGRDMKEIKNITGNEAYCIDFILEIAQFIAVTDENCNQKRLEDYDYYEGEVKVRSHGSWENATGVTVSSASFQFPDGRWETLFDERPGSITWVGVAGKDIYTLLMNVTGTGTLYHFVNTGSGVEEKNNTTISGIQKFYLVTNRNKTETGVFIQADDGVYILDSNLNYANYLPGVTVDIPGYYFIKLSNGNVYDANLNLTTEFDKYIYSDVVNPDGYVYVNGKEVIANNLTSIEGNSKKTYFGNYLFYQPGTASGYDVENVTMINLDYVE